MKQKSKSKRIVGIILDVVLVLMILYIAITLYLRSQGNPHASIFGVTTHLVVSASMEPAIMTHDIIIVKHCDSYDVGDVITYIDNEGRSITHRVIAVDFGSYTVQGDANLYPDENPVCFEQIVGKVILVLSGNQLPHKVPPLASKIAS